MDSFNPFANAWGDDNDSAADASTGNNAASSSASFARRDSLPSWGEPITSTATATASSPSIEDPYPSWGADASTSASSIPGPSRRRDSDAVPSWSAVGASSSVVDVRPASPPAAWSPVAREDDEQEHSWKPQSHDEDDLTGASAGQIPEEEEETGFDGFGAARLPDLRPPDDGDDRQQASHQDDTDTWGETPLPPSAWEERLHAKPTWETPGSKADEEEGWGGQSELEMPVSQQQEDEQDDEDRHASTSE